MQQALHPNPAGAATGGARFLIAGAVVLVGAGLVAVDSAAPSLPGIQERAVHLTSDAWSGVFDAASDNLSALEDRISADPSPVLSQLVENQTAYTEMIGSQFQDFLNGVEGIFSGYGPAVGLQDLLPQVSELLANGEYADAYSLLNTEFLFDLLNVTQPFFDHTVWGTGEAVDGAVGIPGDMFRNLANVSDVFSDYGLWKGLANAALAPGISVMFQSSLGAETVSELFAAGDTEAAFNALANMPAQLAGAFLNGFLPPEEWGGHQMTGLLSEGGILDQLLVTIPGQIAEALGAAPLDEVLDPALAAELVSPADVADVMLAGI